MSLILYQITLRMQQALWCRNAVNHQQYLMKESGTARES